ncbi:MAG: hypothetical protein WKF68_02525 [Daejeonella sp.]
MVDKKTKKLAESKAEELFKIAKTLRFILGQVAACNVKLAIDFSEECEECGIQSGIIMDLRSFYKTLYDKISDYEDSCLSVAEWITVDRFPTYEELEDLSDPDVPIF